MIGSAFAASLCLIMYHLGIGHHMSSMIIGAVIPLVPGVAFTNAIGVGVVLSINHNLTGGMML